MISHHGWAVQRKCGRILLVPPKQLLCLLELVPRHEASAILHLVRAEMQSNLVLSQV